MSAPPKEISRRLFPRQIFPITVTFSRPQTLVSILWKCIQMDTWRGFEHVYQKCTLSISRCCWIWSVTIPKWSKMSFLNVRTWIYVAPYVYANWKDRSFFCNTDHSTHPACDAHTGVDLTLCFSVNMTDREKAAGRGVDDACSHQSFNLFPQRPSSRVSVSSRPLCHTVLLFVSVLIRHSL